MVNSYLPLSREVGLLAAVTHYFFAVAAFSLAGAFVWFLAAQKRVAPEHRAGMVLSAVIVGVAALSYFLMRGFYADALRAVAAARRLERAAYFAVGQFRYMDWLITTPLLLLKTVLVLEVRPRALWRALAVLLVADALMVFTGFIGEQQFTAAGAVDVPGRLFWGTVSSAFYLLVPLTLLYIYRRSGRDAQHWERRAFKILAFATVTTWGVYPLGYLVPAWLPGVSFNWIHIVFNVTDVLNKVGAGVVVYIGAARVLEDRVPKDRVQEAREVA